MLQENILFANRYQLIKLLGRGGFSEVWLAKDNYTHLEIAIKVYAPGQGMDQDGLKDFCGELASVYDLNHSNLLKPQHVDTWNNMPYLIMAYCPAGSCVKRVGKMTETELWKLIHNVASGLAYLHDKDVIHQDIKPDNILVDTEGNFLITDFGISTRARSTLRKSVIGGNTSGGTTAYMGPERFSRQPAPTKASDIWSFGAMAFELLEGVTPFGEIGGGMQKSGAEIPFINAQVSDALKFTIFKMLSKETWDRPTATTLIEWANNPSEIQIDYSLLNPEETAQASFPQPQPTPIINTANETIQTEGRATQRFGSIEQKESGDETISYPLASEENKSTLVLEDENTDNLPSKKNNIFRSLLIALFVGGVFIFFMIFIFGLNSFGLGNPPESTKIATSPKNNTETATNINNNEQNYSESYCDNILITAKKHYDIGYYTMAKEYFQRVIDNCGPNYDAVSMWIKKCEDQIQKLKETRCDTFLLDAKIFYDDKDYLRAKECYQNVVNECGLNYKDAAIWVEICEENIQNKLANIPTKVNASKKQKVNNVELFSNPDKLVFESYGGNKTLTIESSSEYTITSKTYWITIEKIKNNNKSVFVILDKNNSSLERSGYIKVTNIEGKTITISVTQKGNTSK